MSVLKMKNLSMAGKDQVTYRACEQQIQNLDLACFFFFFPLQIPSCCFLMDKNRRKRETEKWATCLGNVYLETQSKGDLKL